MSAKILFDKLLDSKIIGSRGKIFFELNGLKTSVRDISIVGNVIQEWLKYFMDKNDIFYRFKQNSQAFPDFLMHSTSSNIELLEVKCFKKSPNFDIANFAAYSRSLLQHPYRLDADYLIIEYEENVDNSISIKNIWIKKVWEISCGSERSALKIQWKQGQAVNIRPAVWYTNRTKFPLFKTRKDFVKAIKTVIDTNPTMHNIQKDWFKNVSDLYKKQTGNEI